MDGRQTRDLLMQPQPDAVPPDLTLLDLHLPSVNGYDLLEEIKYLGLTQKD